MSLLCDIPVDVIEPAIPYLDVNLAAEQVGDELHERGYNSCTRPPLQPFPQATLGLHRPGRTSPPSSGDTPSRSPSASPTPEPSDTPSRTPSASSRTRAIRSGARPPDYQALVSPSALNRSVASTSAARMPGKSLTLRVVIPLKSRPLPVIFKVLRTGLMVRLTPFPLR